MFVTSQGSKVYVERFGKGKPLVLIHGLGTPSVWTYVRQQLSQFFDVIIIHLPGFGLSDPSVLPLSTHGHAEFIIRILDELQLSKVTTAGISYGGQITATLAQKYPERLESMILVCSSGFSRYALAASPLFRLIISTLSPYLLFNHISIIRLLGHRAYYDKQKLPSEIVEQFHHAMGQRERRENWFQCAWNAAAPAKDFTVNFSSINIPTLILWGRDDRSIPLKHAYQFQQRIKGSEIIIFDECGHALPIEKPEEFCKVIKEFLIRN